MKIVQKALRAQREEEDQDPVSQDDEDEEANLDGREDQPDNDADGDELEDDFKVNELEDQDLEEELDDGHLGDDDDAFTMPAHSGSRPKRKKKSHAAGIEETKEEGGDD